MQNDYTQSEGFSPLFLTRFYKRIDIMPSGCHEWRGTVVRHGYGEHKLWIDGVRRRVRAHRIAMQIVRPDLDVMTNPEVIVRHKCDNPTCCNPEHLEPGTHADNVRDRVERDRSAKGSNNGRAILNEAAVLLCRALIAEGKWSYARIAAVVGVDQATIRYAVTGRTWKSLPQMSTEKWGTHWGTERAVSTHPAQLQFEVEPKGGFEPPNLLFTKK